MNRYWSGRQMYFSGMWELRLSYKDHYFIRQLISEAEIKAGLVTRIKERMQRTLEEYIQEADYDRRGTQ